MKNLFKILTVLLSLTLFSVDEIIAQPPVYGPAVKFEYDAVGQRIKRYYEPNAVLNKFGDTVTQISSPDTIWKKDNHLLINDVLVKAYPNPTADVVIIENLSFQDSDKSEIQLYDITGKLITVRKVSNARESLSLGGLASGTYHVHYYLNSQLLTTWKIIRK